MSSSALLKKIYDMASYLKNIVHGSFIFVPLYISNFCANKLPLLRFCIRKKLTLGNKRADGNASKKST
ncbi:hypothetical protein ATZ36_04175 [Candidatus Endomicrobiellum trichonymphae]|uniref:Uncharacterized protein n=1 Tax=Endomicrobium trichonymphae TaxID=1408204 RepID=A0A1E5IK10_ENDTX|nr:hypothetical protein ATZ36_04300 [Candidatus Endomicrobium trichonymphae]OEG70514.1 hypothetical protein ATZ36_04175 [Candidatus Endomicrobium trichonymphae]